MRGMLHQPATSAAAAAAAATVQRMYSSMHTTSTTMSKLMPTPAAAAAAAVSARAVAPKLWRLPCHQQAACAPFSSSCSSSIRRSVLTSGAATVCLNAGVLPSVWSSSASAWAAATGSKRMATTAAATAPGGPGFHTGVLVVYVTAPSTGVAGSIAEQLVNSKLAACVNILPGITSVYMWKGKVEKDPEVLMIIKTQAALLDQLTAKVKELHPYDEPEVIALAVIGGSASYLKWVVESTAAQ